MSLRVSKLLPLSFAIVATIFVSACGGGGGSTSGGRTTGGGTPAPTANTVPIVIDSGPARNSADQAFVSVTICVPGTSNCKTIDHVQVDTGSSGLRLLSSLVTIPLVQSTTNFECTQFVDMSFLWGPLASADIKMAGEVASNVPVQIISPVTTGVPTTCSQAGGTQVTDATGLGANGIIGMSVFRQDCGPACANSSTKSPYYTCNAGNCQTTTQTLVSQVQNPVPMFTSDNNGVLIQLNQVPDTGQLSGSGTLVFGIGTQTDNALGSATIFTLSPNGNLSTNYKGTPSANPSFIDSGSNGFFFLDAATTGLTACTTAKGFYCPTAQQPFTVTVVGANSSSKDVTFNIGNAETLFQSGFSAFNNIGGPAPPKTAFDLGLSFFYGRSVFTAIEGQATPAGTGPYIAF